MNITYCCPSCDQAVRTELSAASRELTCPACRQAIAVPEDALAGGTLRRCAVCPSTDLFVRKDFPQRLGVALVVVGFIASSVAWYFYMIYLAFAILFATALIDVVLYLMMGENLTCYRCHAQYRSVDGIEAHEPFDLETHERHRQQKIRLAEHRRTLESTAAAK